MIKIKYIKSGIYSININNISAVCGGHLCCCIKNYTNGFVADSKSAITTKEYGSIREFMAAKVHRGIVRSTFDAATYTDCKRLCQENGSLFRSFESPA